MKKWYNGSSEIRNDVKNGILTVSIYRTWWI